MAALREPGQEKLNAVTQKIEEITPHTATRGHELLQQDLRSLQADFDSCFSTVDETTEEIGMVAESILFLEIFLRFKFNLFAVMRVYFYVV